MLLRTENKRAGDPTSNRGGRKEKLFERGLESLQGCVVGKVHKSHMKKKNKGKVSRNITGVQEIIVSRRENVDNKRLEKQRGKGRRGHALTLGGCWKENKEDARKTLIAHKRNRGRLFLFGGKGKGVSTLAVVTERSEREGMTTTKEKNKPDPSLSSTPKTKKLHKEGEDEKTGNKDQR